MARRGRIPKPQAIRVIEGNPGRRPMNVTTPKPRPVAPRCPSWLDADARREWRRVAPELERLGLLTHVDLAALAGYCASFSEWRRFMAIVAKQGATITTPTGQVRTRPEALLARKALADVRLFCAEFGLTPGSRARMQIIDSGYEDDEDSPFDV